MSERDFFHASWVPYASFGRVVRAPKKKRLVKKYSVKYPVRIFYSADAAIVWRAQGGNQG